MTFYKSYADVMDVDEWYLDLSVEYEHFPEDAPIINAVMVGSVDILPGLTDKQAERLYEHLLEYIAEQAEARREAHYDSLREDY